MSFENWIHWLLLLSLTCVPFIIQWYKKTEANRSSNLQNEAPVKWRQFDLLQVKQPFSDWIGASSKGILSVTSDGIYCADISIPLIKIRKATVYSPVNHLLGKASHSILRLETHDTIYDFSISPYRLEKMKWPFELIYEDTLIVSGMFSKIMLTLIILLIFFIILFVIRK